MSGRSVFWLLYLTLILAGLVVAPWYVGALYLIAIPVTFGFLWWDTRRWPTIPEEEEPA